MKGVVREIFKFIYIYFCKDYVSFKKKPTKQILISYLAEPFYKKNDVLYLNKHQNRRETLMMGDVFDTLNCSCKFVRLDKPKLNLRGYNVIFGVEPNFLLGCRQNKKAIKIYYATGAYYKHQNNVIKQRTDEFIQKKGVKVPYYRLIDSHNACEIADYILQIGSDYTILTYPSNLHSKIFKIRQSCHDFHFNDFLSRKLKSYSRKHYIWMGSEGSILKGLDVILDFFISSPDLHIHIIGKIDSEVSRYYACLLESADNIHIYGFLDLNSSVLEQIALKSAFVIMPSASEGLPGSVINMMKLGCIPVVSTFAAFDGIEQHGYLLKDISIKSLDEVIQRIRTLSEDELVAKINSNFEFANHNFNSKTFQKDLLDAFVRIFNNFDNK